jgi:hypothetical protein
MKRPYSSRTAYFNLLTGITRHDIRNQQIAINGFIEPVLKELSDPSYQTGIRKEYRALGYSSSGRSSQSPASSSRKTGTPGGGAWFETAVPKEAMDKGSW